MEVELGLKLTKSLDEFASADLRIVKGRSGPLFISRETEIMFILTAHLKGCRIWIPDSLNCAVYLDSTIKMSYACIAEIQLSAIQMHLIYVDCLHFEPLGIKI